MAEVIYPNLNGINKSNFIQKYIRTEVDAETKEFLFGFILEEMDKELSHNGNIVKKSKV